MINCTGAQTCKLGICLPRGLSKALHDKLGKSDLDLDAIPDFKLNMSGCPNTCGMHHIADLGFFGKIGRKDGAIYPAYNVLAGAKRGAGQMAYAEKVGDIPSHAVPELVYRFLKNYIEEKDEYDDYHAYLKGEGIALIQSLCEELKEVPNFEDDRSYYIDFGAKRPLRLDDMGTAECSAGMFDMINVDKKEIESYLTALSTTADKASTLDNLLFHTSRMLLVTRGLDANAKIHALELFAKHFVETELVSIDYLDLMNAAKAGDMKTLIAKELQAIALANEVLELYKNMDDSLRFKTKKEQPVQSAEASLEGIKKDYRGVACPMNFVKTKLVLETMNSGQQLEILLDDGEPIENVPNSVKLEGHKILKQEKDGPHWVVVIEKK
jgi:sulfite reductase (ferredoxin)